MRKCLKMQNAHERIIEVCERKSGQEGFLPKENEFNLEQNEIERQLGIVRSENERRRTSVF